MEYHYPPPPVDPTHFPELGFQRGPNSSAMHPSGGTYQPQRNTQYPPHPQGMQTPVDGWFDLRQDQPPYNATPPDTNVYADNLYRGHTRAPPNPSLEPLFPHRQQGMQGVADPRFPQEQWQPSPSPSNAAWGHSSRHVPLRAGPVPRRTYNAQANGSQFSTSVPSGSAPSRNDGGPTPSDGSFIPHAPHGSATHYSDSIPLPNRPGAPASGATRPSYDYAVRSPQSNSASASPLEPVKQPSSRDAANSQGSHIPILGGVIPIDIGPGATYDEVMNLWKSLNSDDQLRLMEGYKRSLPQPHNSTSAPSPTTNVPPAEKSSHMPLPRLARQATQPVPMSELPGSFMSSGAPADEVPSRPFPKTYRTPFVSDADDESTAQDHESRRPTPTQANQSFSRQDKGKNIPRTAQASQSLANEQPSLKTSSAAGHQGTNPVHLSETSTFSAVKDDTNAGVHIGVVMLDAVQRVDDRISQLEETMSRFFGKSGSKKGNSKRPNHSSQPTHTRMAFDSEDSAQAMHEVSSDEGEGANAESSDSASDVHSEDARLPAGQREKQKAIDQPHRNRLSACVRFHLDIKLLGVKNLETLHVKFPTLTRDEVKAYEQVAASVMTPENFRVDFVRGWKRFPLNIEAREFFIDHFLESIAGGSYNDPPIPERFLTRRSIGNALDSHMSHLRSEFKRRSQPRSDTVLAKELKVKLRKRNAARQKTTLNNRKLIVRLHGMVNHLRLLDKLKPCHMSGDEAEVDSDGDNRQTWPRTYYIIEAAWQSNGLKQLLHTLDDWHIADWRQCIGDRLPGGNPPRRRVALANPRVVDTPAPKGLWQNCYNQTWLNSLKPHQRNMLHIIEEDYDFSLPPWTMPDELQGVAKEQSSR